MKIGGHEVTAPSEELLVFPRASHPIVFKAKALPDMDEFYKLVPEPKPPGKLTRDGWIPQLNDPSYTEIMSKHVKQKVGYMVTRTLMASEIEWDTVDIDNPRTWPNWETDLRNAGMTQAETNRLAQLIMETNGLNEAKLIEARESFLLGQALEQSGFSIPSSEQPSTPSGELAPVSE